MNLAKVPLSYFSSRTGQRSSSLSTSLRGATPVLLSPIYPLQFLYWTVVWFCVLPIAFGVLVPWGPGPRGVLYGS